MAARQTRRWETLLLRSSHGLVAMAAVVVLWAAAGVSEASPPPSEPDDVLADVGELFRSGQDHFETSDFDEAIKLWTRAYEELPHAPEHQPIRAMLLANLAQAHVQAYAIDESLEHLRQADGLFVRYLELIDPADAQTHDTIEAERRRIAGILEEAEQRQREQERATRPEPAPAEPVSLEPVLPLPPATPTPSNRRSLTAEPYSPSERALVIGGGVTLAFGLGLTGATGAFLWLRTEEERRGSAASRNPTTGVAELREFGQNAIRFNRLAISTGAASGVLVAIGLGLVGTAAVHRKHRLSDRARVGLGPGSFVVRGRF